jgi:hypothetical protein
MDGKAQKLTDIGGMGDSSRVCGCDLFGTSVMAGTVALNAAFGGTATYFVSMTPGNISTRLTNLEEMFQYYAIRKLNVIYVPKAATSVSVNVALGLIQDADTVANAVVAPTQQQILELSPSLLTPVWNVASMVYTHTGMKLWSTSTLGSVPSGSDTQLVVAGTLNGGTSATVYGSLWLEYCIDFYKPSPVLSSPSIYLDAKLSHISRRSSRADVIDALQSCLAKALDESTATASSSSSLSSIFTHKHHTHTSTDSDEKGDVVVVTEPPSSDQSGRVTERRAGSTAAKSSDPTSDALPVARPVLTSARGGYFNFASSAVSK